MARRAIPTERALAQHAQRREVLVARRERANLQRVGWQNKQVRDRALAAQLEEQELLGSYATLEDAEAAERRTSFATGLAVGLSIVAVLGFGVILCYLLFRRRDEGEISGPQIITIDRQAAEPVKVLPRTSRTPTPQEAPVPYRQSARMRSFTLPQVGVTSAFRVATADRANPIEVVVRVVGPAGAFGIFSLDPNELNLPNLAAIPVGETLVVPTGDHQRMRLEARQVLYGVGNVSGVTVSVTSAAEV